MVNNNDNSSQLNNGFSASQYREAMGPGYQVAAFAGQSLIAGPPAANLYDDVSRRMQLRPIMVELLVAVVAQGRALIASRAPRATRAALPFGAECETC